jgi:hypothetical protein
MSLPNVGAAIEEDSSLLSSTISPKFDSRASSSQKGLVVLLHPHQALVNHLSPISSSCSWSITSLLWPLAFQFFMIVISLHLIEVKRSAILMAVALARPATAA